MTMIKPTAESVIAWTQKTIDELLEAEPYLLEYQAYVAGGTWWQNHSDYIRELSSALSQDDLNLIAHWCTNQCNDDYLKYALQFFEAVAKENSEKEVS